MSWGNYILKIQDDWGEQDTAAILRRRVDNRFLNLRKNTPRRGWTCKNDFFLGPDLLRLKKIV
jgi:hypothetical protein